MAKNKARKAGKCPVTRKDFMEWINNYTDWIGFHESTSGKTVFMDMAGFDGGDVYEDGLESGAKFANPDSVDKEIREACKHFGESYPTKSFKDFCKEKFGEW